MNTDRKRKRVVRFQKYALNPITRLVAGTFPGWVLLETTGRRSGKRRRVPLGGTREGDSYFIVSEQGMKANYVQNIVNDPEVRIKIGTRWREGTAHILPDDDTAARLAKQSLWNRTAVRSVGTDLLTVRVDMRDPSQS